MILYYLHRYYKGALRTFLQKNYVLTTVVLISVIFKRLDEYNVTYYYYTVRKLTRGQE